MGKNSHEISQCVKCMGKKGEIWRVWGQHRVIQDMATKTREGWRRCDFYQRVSGFHYDFLKPNFMNEMWFFFLSRSPSSSPLLSSFPFLIGPLPPSLVSSLSSHPLVPFFFPPFFTRDCIVFGPNTFFRRNIHTVRCRVPSSFIPFIKNIT